MHFNVSLSFTLLSTQSHSWRNRYFQLLVSWHYTAGKVCVCCLADILHNKERGSNCQQECRIARSKWENIRIQAVWFDWLSFTHLLPVSPSVTSGATRNPRRAESLARQKQTRDEGNMRLAVVVGSLANQTAWDNLIPSFNVSCAKNAKRQVEEKH